MPGGGARATRGQGYPWGLRAVAIYQPVKNYFSILTTNMVFPEIISKPSMGVTKPVKPRTWWDCAEREVGALPGRTLRSVPSLQLTAGLLPLPRWDTRRRLHRSSASLYTLHTFRSGFLWGSRGHRSTGVKQLGSGEGIPLTASKRQ